MAPSDAQKACLLKIAEGIERSQLGRIINGEVLTWLDGKMVRVAFRHNALTLERLYGYDFPNHRHELDANLQRALGFEVTVPKGYGLDSDLGQKLSDGNVSWDELEDAIGDMVSAAYGRCLGIQESDWPSVSVALMPKEGAPIGPYASGRKGWQKGSKGPATVKEKLDRFNEEPPVEVADMCQILDRVEYADSEIIARPYANELDELLVKPTSDFMVMHATNPIEEAGAAVSRCGGWMFASLAVSMVPPVQFGPLVLFGGTSLILSGLKPYRARGVRSVTVYDTDVWTSKSGSYAKIARTLLGQLTGRPELDEMHEKHQWILGDLTKTEGFANMDVKVIETTTVLRRVLLARAKTWKPTLTPAQAAAIYDKMWDTVHSYPYLEAKTNGILAPSCWKLAIVARSYEKAAKAYMKRAGVKAPLLVVDDPPEVPKDHWHLERDHAWVWSQEVARVARDYAVTHNLIRTYA